MKEILLVDDHAMIREAIKMYLHDSKEFVITGEAENGKEAYELLCSKYYDLVITDLRMPEMNGENLIKRIRSTRCNQKVMTLSMDNDPNKIKELIKMGVKGHLMKNVRKEEFINSLQVVSMGGNYFSDYILHKEDSFSIGEQVRNFSELSTRKKVFLCGRLVLEGASMIFF